MGLYGFTTGPGSCHVICINRYVYPMHDHRRETQRSFAGGPCSLTAGATLPHCPRRGMEEKAHHRRRQGASSNSCKSTVKYSLLHPLISVPDQLPNNLPKITDQALTSQDPTNLPRTGLSPPLKRRGTVSIELCSASNRLSAQFQWREEPDRRVPGTRNERIIQMHLSPSWRWPLDWVGEDGGRAAR